MYRSALVLLTVVATLVHGSVMKAPVPELDGRIVGGEDTTIEKYPYQVSLRANGLHICGASIIGSDVCLTSAHCIISSKSTGRYSVQYGTANIGGDYNVLEVVRIIRHPNYSSWTHNNDLALIYVSNDFSFSSTVQKIALPTEEPAPGTHAVVTGWGYTREGGVYTKFLQEVQVDIVSNDVCNEQYVDVITKSMLCAGVIGGGKDACQGDSGGPLAFNGTLVGVVSWGFGCARPEYAGVYANVAHQRSWIDANLP